MPSKSKPKTKGKATKKTVAKKVNKKPKTVAKPTGKRRGRPPGAKNKPKEPPAPSGPMSREERNARRADADPALRGDEPAIGSVSSGPILRDPTESYTRGSGPGPGMLDEGWKPSKREGVFATLESCEGLIEIREAADGAYILDVEQRGPVAEGQIGRLRVLALAFVVGTPDGWKREGLAEKVIFSKDSPQGWRRIISDEGRGSEGIGWTVHFEGSKSSVGFSDVGSAVKYMDDHSKGPVFLVDGTTLEGFVMDIARAGETSAKHLQAGNLDAALDDAIDLHLLVCGLRRQIATARKEEEIGIELDLFVFDLEQHLRGALRPVIDVRSSEAAREEFATVLARLSPLMERFGARGAVNTNEREYSLNEKIANEFREQILRTLETSDEGNKEAARVLFESAEQTLRTVRDLISN